MKLILASLLTLAISQELYSQLNFTRITDPSNPVVTDLFESTGGCWVDFNNDGWLDLFAANGNVTSQNNSLYLNNRAGSFIKIITGPVVNDGGTSIGGTWGDFNNDGNLDLFVSNRNNFGNFLYRGNGDTTFTKITTGNIATDLTNSNSAGWVDINRDGLVDLHLINFSQNDLLYFNNGNPNFTFTKIDTASFLLDGSGFSIAGEWADYNNDRLPDFFVGNSGAQNDFIFKNNGNLTFTKTILTDARATLGASWGDYDNDGDLDLFTSVYLNQKSLLFNNSGAPNYTFTQIDTGIVSNDPSNSVGSCWGDFDNDGDLDLFVGNDGTNNFLYINSGAPNYSFTKITTGSIVNDGGNTFGCATGDYDNDGQLDIFAANRLNQQNFLYRNNGNSNKWITIKCVGITSNKAAIGTKVRIKAAINGSPRWQMQEVMPQTGYNSQNLWLHFGTGNAASIDSIRVEWINGSTHNFTNVGTNQFITILENGTIIGINKNNEEVPDNYNLYQNYPNPFNPGTIISFDIPVGTSHGAFVRLIIFDITGKQISEVVNRNQAAGKYKVSFSALNLSSGIYFYSLIVDGNVVDTKKMILIK
ncbi:MAG TPA: FG-GAP-like repeat-containing protein [Ignavibacteria bacterium]